MTTSYYPSLDPLDDTPIRIDREPNVSGTSLQGNVFANYSELLEAFGPPNHCSDVCYEDGGGKVNCEWDLIIDGEPVTIYDWKEGKKYTKVTDWHVGGHDKHAHAKVKEALKCYRAWKKSGAPRIWSNPVQSSEGK